MLTDLQDYETCSRSEKVGLVGSDWNCPWTFTLIHVQLYSLKSLWCAR